jgi:cysteine-rich repeat protein
MRSVLLLVPLASCSIFVSGLDINDACGNSVLQANLGETCDDGNKLSGDGCSADCLNEVACGNGNLDAGEACDDGANNSNSEPNACRLDCTNPSCGDIVTDSGEGCDDGNIQAGDGCSATCVVERCGDGIDNNNNTEQCDNGNANSDTTPDACRTDCQRAGCGDGVIDTGEDCDDSNNTNGDDCDSACQSEVLAEVEFNGTIATAQPLDNTLGKLDGALDNIFDIDFFKLTVTTTSTISIEVTQASLIDGSSCAAGDNDPDTILYLFNSLGQIIKENDDNGPGNCSRLDLSRLAPGDYFVRINDFGFQGTIDNYRLEVDFVSLCGDGAVGPNEECDDNNVVDGDGCQADCTDGNNCGDNILDRGEQCDDGDLANNDGCDNLCQVEPGNFFEQEPNDDAHLEESNAETNTDFLVANLNGPFTADTVIHGAMLINGGDEDFYLITNTTGAAAFLTVQTGNQAVGVGGVCGADTDTVLRVYAFDGTFLGNVLDFNDDSNGIGLCSLVQDVPIAAGQSVVLQVFESSDDDELLDYLARIDLH